MKMNSFVMGEEVIGNLLRNGVVFSRSPPEAVMTSSECQDKENRHELFPEPKNGFCSASLSLRVQKKLASRLSTRTVAKQFVSEAGARLFDSLFEVLKVHFSKKIAEKTVKNMIKLAVKLGLVSRSGALSYDEEQLLRTAQMKVRSLALTIISFKKVAYSYDRVFLVELANEMKKALSQVVDLHLSDKSGKRLDHVFEHLGKQEVLDALFRVNGPHAEHLNNIASDLETLIDAKEL